MVVFTLRSSAECTSGSYMLLWAEGAAARATRAAGVAGQQGQQGNRSSRTAGAAVVGYVGLLGREGTEASISLQALALIIVKSSYQQSRGRGFWATHLERAAPGPLSVIRWR